MRRLQGGIRLVIPQCVRQCSGWGNGSSGYDWKARDLAERRRTALTYMSDISKRVPIHNAVRQKAGVNREAIRAAGAEARTLFDVDAILTQDEDEFETFDELIDDLLLDENIERKLDFINHLDVPLLDSELLDNRADDLKVLRRWLKLRKETADYQSYAAIPPGERTNWSAWYLRNVKSRGGDEDQ